MTAEPMRPDAVPGVTPYYADDWVTIWHGDCREMLPSLSADVVVTDPPYGIGWASNGGGRKGKMRWTRNHPGIAGDADTSVRDAALSLTAPAPAMVFGSFRAPFPAETRQVLIYQKSADAGLVGSVTGFRADIEAIFLVGPWPTRTCRWSSVIKSSTGLQRLQAVTGHPHTKPVDVMARLIEACPPGVVLDPFAGSGSTLVAAKSLGRRSIGVEIEERYCEVAANRCRQEVLGLIG